MYTVGRKLVPIHVLCGVWWEILKPDGTRLCAIVGDKEVAEEVVNLLNQSQSTNHAPIESPDYDPAQSPKKER